MIKCDSDITDVLYPDITKRICILMWVAIVMIYGTSDPGRSRAGGTAVGGRQTDMQCRESLGMKCLFSGYWEGI